MVKSHEYILCKKCKVSYRKEEYDKHRCGEAIVAFLCDLGSCRERYYYRLNFFVRHLQIEHKIAEFKTIKYLIENNCKEIIKPSKPSTKFSMSSKERSSKSSNKNDNKEYEEFVTYVD